MKTRSFIATVAGMASILVPSMSEAANRFGVACVTNRTNTHIQYRFKVGSGPWQVRKMGPGEARAFHHRYEGLNENKSPPLEISYDSDARSGRKFTVTKVLERKAAVGDSCKEGKQYAFRYEPKNPNFILLDLAE